MRWYLQNWYYVGGVVALAALGYLLFRWNDLDTLQRLLLANFALAPLHELEEYGWPGGEPAIMNKVIQPSDQPDRYPLNQLSAMIVNVPIAYGFLFAAFLFSDLIWLGLGAVLFWIGQLVIHGVITNRKLMTIYNPGLLTTLMGVGILIYYAYHVQAHDLASGWDWVFGFVTFIAFALIALVWITYRVLADKDSPYHFSDAEMRRWNVDARLAHAQNPQIGTNTK